MTPPESHPESHPETLAGLGSAAALRRLQARLDRAGIDAPDAEARLLFEAATGLGRAALVAAPEAALADADAERLDGFLARRLAGEPATRIAGRRGFWTLELRVAPDVLDPRPDSETIVEAALAELGARRTQRLRLLDLGTGTGALLLALLSECPEATGLGVDLSPAALAVARENAIANGLAGRADFRLGRWMEGIEGPFDLVVSNPPYIESAAIDGLDREVRAHDPRLALDGGPDGLDAYRAILAGLKRILAPDARAVLELGYGQAAAVSRLAAQSGLMTRAIREDLGGVPRALVLAAEAP